MFFPSFFFFPLLEQSHFINAWKQKMFQTREPRGASLKALEVFGESDKTPDNGSPDVRLYLYLLFSETSPGWRFS